MNADAVQLFARTWDSNLDAALAYAGAGLPVFPCTEKKTPRIKGGRGFADASTDKETIQRWWGSEYPDALIGMPTGRISALVVIDVDDMTVFTALHLPRTFTVTTPRLGRHCFFQHPCDGLRIKCTQGELAPKVDTRADGGYVIIPPSATKKGRYAVSDNTPPQPLPEDLRERLQEKTGNELQRSQRLQRSHEIVLTSMNSITSIIQPREDEIERVIAKTLPQSFGQRHRQVFDLARGLRFDCGMESVDPVKLKPLVRRWHEVALPNISTKDFDETWTDFLGGWEKAKSGLCGGTLADAAKKANAGDLPKEAKDYAQATQLLIGICWHLSKTHPQGEFFLSSYQAAEIIGSLSQPVIHRRLWMLTKDGVIECIGRGDSLKRQANRYRWKGNRHD